MTKNAENHGPLHLNTTKILTIFILYDLSDRK